MLPNKATPHSMTCRTDKDWKVAATRRGYRSISGTIGAISLL
jgi:hypothetical protein